MLALLAVIAAILAVGLALLAASDEGVQPIDRQDAQEQIDELRNFIDENAR